MTANFEDDEEGELHFDDLDETETSRPECMTVDQEPGVCVTLRRCHPILFGANGELRHASLAEEFSQNVDSCVNTVEDNKPMPAMDQEDDDIVRSIPAEIGKGLIELILFLLNKKNCMTEHQCDIALVVKFLQQRQQLLPAG